MEVTPEALARFFEVTLPHVNELQRRVVAGAMSEMLGRGHKTAVAVASGMSRNTVIKAEAEVAAGIEPSVRLRAVGRCEYCDLTQDELTFAMFSRRACDRTAAWRDRHF